MHNRISYIFATEKFHNLNCLILDKVGRTLFLKSASEKCGEIKMTVNMLDQFSQAPDLTHRLDTVQDFFVQFGHEISISSLYLDLLKLSTEQTKIG